jgi:trehalose-phosphatase
MPYRPPPTGGSRIRDLPDALERGSEIAGLLRGRAPAVFLDYDGTLSPIVDDPGAAHLPRATRDAIERLAELCPVAVVSGRDVADVRVRVGVEGIWYAGSHGLDLVGPAGRAERRGEEHVPALDAAEAALRAAVESIPGASVERKRLSVAVHHRRARPERAGEIEAAVDRVAADLPGLRMALGKKVFELRPDIPWDKGRAVEWLVQTLGLDPEAGMAVYVGDDVTDEDAFRALGGRGVGVVIRGEDDERATAARWSLPDPASVPALLAGIADALERR